MLYVQRVAFATYLCYHSIYKKSIPMEKFMKKFISLMLIVALSLSFLPTYAINDSDVSKIKESRDKIKQNNLAPAKNKFDYVNMTWWKNFDDRYLDNYIIRAVENNKDLKMATLTIDEFYQNVKMQRANQLPSVTTGFLPGYGEFNGDTAGSFLFPMIASYELDLFGKNHNKTQSVRKLYEASILDERAAYISIASAVGSVYINIVKLDAMIDLQTEIVALRKEIYEMMDLSNKEGITSTSDLVKANSAYIAGVTDLTELKKQRTQLLHSLAVLIGDSPNNTEEFQRCSWKDLAYKGEIPVYVSSDIIVNRPDYLKAEKLLEKSGIDVKIARKECLPSINLGGMYIFKSDKIGSLLTTSNALWGLGGGLLWNVFAGGKIKANLKSKKIAYEKALKNYEKVNLTSMQEVNDSLVAINMDKEKLLKQQDIQKLEQKDFELSSLKYKEGIISKLDLNQRKENLLNVNKMVYSSQFDCMIDYISFYKAVGSKV